MKIAKYFFIMFCVLFFITGCDSDNTIENTANKNTEEISVSTDTSKIDNKNQTEQTKLRFDGLYCCIENKDSDSATNTILRFYEDRTVISASIGSPTEKNTDISILFPAGNWFNRESEYGKDKLGTYNIENNRINFVTISENGTVDYEGEININLLILDCHSNINGFESKGNMFEFYPFSNIPKYDPL